MKLTTLAILVLALGLSAQAANAASGCPQLAGIYTCDLPENVAPWPSITFRAEQAVNSAGNTELSVFSPPEETVPGLKLEENVDSGGGSVGSLTNTNFYCSPGKLNAMLTSASIFAPEEIPAELKASGEGDRSVTIWSETEFFLSKKADGGLTASVKRTRSSTDPSIKPTYTDTYTISCRAGR
jgi:hypothetical protein